MVKTTVATKAFDSAEYLDTPEAIAAYLEDIFEDNNPALIAHGIGVVARAKGMTELAEKAGLSRETLYRTLSADGTPQLATLIKVLSELGLKLGVKAEATPVRAKQVKAKLSWLSKHKPVQRPKKPTKIRSTKSGSRLTGSR